MITRGSDGSVTISTIVDNKLYSQKYNMYSTAKAMVYFKSWLKKQLLKEKQLKIQFKK